MQPASRRPRTLSVMLIVTLLIAQALATAARPALAAASQPADRPVMQVSFLKMSFFGIDYPYNPAECFAHGLYASACKISPSYDTAFRRR